MVHRHILVALILLLLAWPAAADPVRSFPDALHDAACTDDFDTPAASTTYVPQTSGSSDGLCDGNTVITTGALVADTFWGPITAESNSMFIVFEATAATGGDTGYRFCIIVPDPWTSGDYVDRIGCSDVVIGNDAAGQIAFGPLANDTSSFLSGDGFGQAMPSKFKVELDLNTATSWTGSIGLVFIPGGN